jgi:hypothetical protein
MSNRVVGRAASCVLLAAGLAAVPLLAQANAPSAGPALWVVQSDSLIRLSDQGAPELTVPLTREATSAAVDPSSGALWVGQRGAVSKYSPDGVLLVSLDVTPGSRHGHRDRERHRVLVTVDADEGRPWVTWDRTLLAAEADGSERFSLALPSPAVALTFNSVTGEL